MNEEPIVPVAAFPDLSLAQITVTQGNRLPRWEAQGAVYDISLHLADSVPATQLVAWRKKRELVRQALSDPGLSKIAHEALVAELKSDYDLHVEKFLTAGYGECWLKRSEAAQAVADVLKHDNETRYALHVYAIMPNHLHVIVGGFSDAGEMKDTVNQWKCVSAHAVNRINGRKGELWHRDAYTRIIRNREEYVAKLKYVWCNPESAGLTQGFLRERFVRW